jgi:hypothetical protein
VSLLLRRGREKKSLRPVRGRRGDTNDKNKRVAFSLSFSLVLSRLRMRAARTFTRLSIDVVNASIVHSVCVCVRLSLALCKLMIALYNSRSCKYRGFE